ncbi:hypothetical protein WN51_13837 [Melipona quadrifasciata]|uniref:Uncharacterized protein n=1 Tax=Melipona quadrifasciata TaxID=166423 RepID=A0A0M9A1B1_9HYME|nr:hypothetical protein WN51_13837 [Melipona quadrifasciata]
MQLYFTVDPILMDTWSVILSSPPIGQLKDNTSKDLRNVIGALLKIFCTFLCLYRQHPQFIDYNPQSDLNISNRPMTPERFLEWKDVNRLVDRGGNANQLLIKQQPCYDTSSVDTKSEHFTDYWRPTPKIAKKSRQSRKSEQIARHNGAALKNCTVIYKTSVVTVLANDAYFLQATAITSRRESVESITINRDRQLNRRRAETPAIIGAVSEFAWGPIGQQEAVDRSFNGFALETEAGRWIRWKMAVPPPPPPPPPPPKCKDSGKRHVKERYGIIAIETIVDNLVYDILIELCVLDINSISTVSADYTELFTATVIQLSSAIHYNQRKLWCTFRENLAKRLRIITQPGLLNELKEPTKAVCTVVRDCWVDYHLTNELVRRSTMAIILSGENWTIDKQDDHIANAGFVNVLQNVSVVCGIDV